MLSDVLKAVAGTPLEFQISVTLGGGDSVPIPPASSASVLSRLFRSCRARNESRNLTDVGGLDMPPEAIARLLSAKNGLRSFAVHIL